MKKHSIRRLYYTYVVMFLQMPTQSRPKGLSTLLSFTTWLTPLPLATQAPFELLYSIIPWYDFLGNAVAFQRQSPYIILRPSSKEAIFLFIGLRTLYDVFSHSYYICLCLAAIRALLPISSVALILFALSI